MDKNKGSYVVSTFAGIGKSFFVIKYSSLAIDLEAIPSRHTFVAPDRTERLQERDFELLKGLVKQVSPEFPNNYVKEIITQLGRFPLILIVLSLETLVELDTLGIKYSIIYPELSMKNEILDRMRRRGNNEEFISKINKTLSSKKEIRALRERLNPEKLIIAKKGEYLEKILKNEYPELFM